MKRYPYKSEDYNKYLDTQKDAVHRKIDKLGYLPVWTTKNNIGIASKLLKEREVDPKFGICHGARSGKEVEWFSEYFPECEVIGTDLCVDFSVPDTTVEWDFNKRNPNWVRKADFIYTNSFDHTFDPRQTILIWAEQLTPEGICVIEHGVSHNHESGPNSLDMVCIDKSEYIDLVSEWLGEDWKAEIISGKRMNLGINRKSIFVLVYRKSRENTGFLFDYRDYEDYLSSQIQTTKNKRKRYVWAEKRIMSQVAWLKRDAKNVMCHGARTGVEMVYLRKFLPHAKVIGTDITDKWIEDDSIIIWDFNKPKKCWMKHFDLIYSNSFDHCYSPTQTAKVWAEQLTIGGMCVIEWSSKSQTEHPKRTDPIRMPLNLLIEKIEESIGPRFSVGVKYMGKVQKRYEADVIVIRREK